MRKLRNSELGRLTVEEYQKSEKTPLVVVCDNVRSMHNVGSIFRTSDCFRVAGLHLCGLTPLPGTAEMEKTALGATETVPWRHWEHTLQAVAHLKEAGFTVVALEQAEGSIDLREYRPQGPTAVVLGHEVIGVAQEVVNACDAALEIKQYGTKHSLNVSVSAALAIYELHKQLG